MEFEEVLEQVITLLQRQGRVSYGALKRRLQLDDDYLEDLKIELIEAQRLAVDENSRILVWVGGQGAAPLPSSQPARDIEPAPVTYTPVHLAEKILASRATLEGERKQITVLFADIKDSTELIRDLDPEAAQQLLDPVIHHMMEAVHRFEGTVNQVLGDGIMALFGAPIAHEDHALRACYTALAMQATMRDYTEEVRRTQGLELRIRVGLNAGEVVVRAIGNDLHMDYSAVGQTTHLAARMEQLATPGTIRLTATTLRLVEGLVRVNALGPIPIKGLDEPVEVFELAGATAVRQRFQARAAQGLTRFVGRQRELDTLQQAQELAGTGHGQVVALVGEAGVGKSRLVYEFAHSHHTQGWRVLESASVSYGKATPYFPVLELLKRYCHLEDHDDHRTIRAKVTGQVLTLDEILQETTPALLALLDALPADSPFLALDPPQRCQRTLDALKRVLLRETQVQPLVLIFEDLHWLDAETQALLDSLIGSLPTARLLLLVNYRPEYQHGWGSKTYYTQLRLDPLHPASADELLQALLGDDASLAPLTRLLIARTVGNPFFLEESVRTLVETGVLVGQPGAYRLAQALPTIQVPATVQAVLAARMDRLPPQGKQLLQTAAVIGTEVTLPLLQAIADLPDEALYHHPAHLQAAEFLYETRLFPEREYTFKHALTHEVAYSSLLQERRRLLHAHIVGALEQQHADRLAEQVERLAHHALRGEVWDKAVAYLRQAGAKVAARSANREAVAYQEQALVALQHLPERHDTLAQAIDLRIALRQSLYPLGEFGRILEYLHEAETLAIALGDQHRLGWILVYMSNYFTITGNLDRAIELGQRALTVAEAVADLALQVEVNYRLGQVYWALGDYGQAIAYFKMNVVYLEGDLIRERFGMPGLPSVLSRDWLVRSLAEQGAFIEGRERGEDVVRLAEALAATIDHPFSLSSAYYGVGHLYLRHGDVDKAIPALERSLEVCQVGHIRLLIISRASLLGYAYALAGRVAVALPLLEQAVEQAASMGFTLHQSLMIAQLSEAYLMAGRMDEALTQAQGALELSREHQERGHQAWVHRLLGEIHSHPAPPEVEPAATHYRQALALAEELGMRPLQAHCHCGLGTLYCRIGQREQARAELSAAIDLYRAMDMTFWLPQAELVLAQLEARS
jgi:class 3 adenylate cyclase/tetratricopeptide (TPR) repeat protein